jgi:hypothetical protein
MIGNLDKMGPNMLKKSNTRLQKNQEEGPTNVQFSLLSKIQATKTGVYINYNPKFAEVQNMWNE